MHQKATSTKNFYVQLVRPIRGPRLLLTYWADYSLSLIDRSRNCGCDCHSVRHQHSLIDLRSKGHQEHKYAPYNYSPGSSDLSTNRAIIEPEDHCTQVASTLTAPRHPSTTSALPTEKESCLAGDSVAESPSRSESPLHNPSSTFKNPAVDGFSRPSVVSPLSYPTPSLSRSICQDCRKFVGGIKERLHLNTLLPRRFRRGPKTTAPPSSQAAELDSSTMYEMPVPQSAELESPTTGQPTSLIPAAHYQDNDMMMALNALGSWSDMSELPADYPMSPSTSRGQFVQNSTVAKGPGDHQALHLGGSNDFAEPIQSDTFDLLSPSIQNRISSPTQAGVPSHSHINDFLGFPDWPQADITPTPPPNYQTSLNNMARPRSPRLPTLKVDTVGIQGKYLSPQSSRRPSFQASPSGSAPSQCSSTTRSVAQLSPWSLTQASSATPLSSHPSSGQKSSARSFHYASAPWSSEYALLGVSDDILFSPHVEKHLTTTESSTPGFNDMPSYRNLFDDASAKKDNPPMTNTTNMFFPEPSPSVPRFQDASPIPFTTKTANMIFPKPSSSVPPTARDSVFQFQAPLQLRAPPTSAPPPKTQPPLQQHFSTRPPQARGQQSTDEPLGNDVCERCGIRFKSKPRDLARNKRRHLEISCPYRDREPVRVPCSVSGCWKTFARDCARRIHERNKHGLGGMLRRQEEIVTSVDMSRDWSDGWHVEQATGRS